MMNSTFIVKIRYNNERGTDTFAADAGVAALGTWAGAAGDGADGNVARADEPETEGGVKPPGFTDGLENEGPDTDPTDADGPCSDGGETEGIDTPELTLGIADSDRIFFAGGGSA